MQLICVNLRTFSEWFFQNFPEAPKALSPSSNTPEFNVVRFLEEIRPEVGQKAAQSFKAIAGK